MNRFPWFMRVWLILDWFFDIMLDQVNPGYDDLFVPPSLWPGWGWGTINALLSHNKRPWLWAETRRRMNDEPMSFYNDEDDDDDEL